MKTNDTIFIPLNDTNIVNLAVTETFIPGTCDTCDFGQNYLQDIRFEADDDRSFAIEFEDSGYYPISVSEFTQLILNNLDRYRDMDYVDFKAEMKDLEDRSYSDIKRSLNSEEPEQELEQDDNIEQEEVIEQEQTSVKPKQSFFANKDVYALVKDPTETRTKVLWDVRNTKDSNNEAISQLADSWGRTAVKIVERGVPCYQNASADQLREIPQTTLSVNYQSSIIRDTYNKVQKGLNLADYDLQASVNDLVQTDALEQ